MTLYIREKVGGADVITSTGFTNGSCVIYYVVWECGRVGKRVSIVPSLSRICTPSLCFGVLVLVPSTITPFGWSKPDVVI